MHLPTKDFIIGLLKKQNVSITIQRIAVLEFLLKNPIHPSVEEIYQALKPHFLSISKATVYNTLLILKEQGIIQEITIEKKQARYDGNPNPHGHFFCYSCQKVFDVEAQFELKEKGFKVDAFQSYFYGHCPYCEVKK